MLDDLMLMYLGQGPRYYGDAPLRIITRPNWEFQAVLQGRIAPWLKKGSGAPAAQTLWIFPPRMPHGWRGEPGKAAQVAVFHFPAIPACLEEAIPEQGYLVVPLKVTHCRRLNYLAGRAATHFQRPGPVSPLNAEHTLLELCLMALEAYPGDPPEDSVLRCHSAVEAALAWYSDHLPEAPGLSDLSRAVNLSTAHLRRLFHRTLGCSPQAAMSRIQFQRATNLMTDPQLSLETIATLCGYGSASSFSRAFKHHFGYPPLVWRQSLQPQSSTLRFSLPNPS